MPLMSQALWAAFESALDSEKTPSYQLVVALGAALVDALGAAGACKVIRQMPPDHDHHDLARHVLNFAVNIAAERPPRESDLEGLPIRLCQIEKRGFWRGVRREWAKLREACRQELQWDAPPPPGDLHETLISPEEAAVLLALFRASPVTMTIEASQQKVALSEKTIGNCLRSLRDKTLAEEPAPKKGWGLTARGRAVVASLPPGAGTNFLRPERPGR
jgi:hypothetical protein